MSQARQARIVEAAAVGLFFIQALRAVISALFGILYDYGFEGSVNAWSVGAVGLMAVAFLAPLLSPRKHIAFALTGAALVTFATRPVLNVNELMPRYWAGLIVLAAGGVYLAALIRNTPNIVAPSLIVALVLDQVLRALGNTYDLGIRPDFLATQIAISLGLVLLAFWIFSKRESPAPSGQLSVTGGLAVGAALFVLTSLLALPNAIARWSDFEYTAIAPMLIAVTCIPLLPPIRDAAQQLQSRQSRVGLLGLLLIGLVIGYQRWEIWSALGLLAACMATLVCLMRAIAPHDEKPDRTGLGLTLGLLLLLALNLALAFSFTYPYTLPLMRGMGLPVYLAAGCIMAWPLFASAVAFPAVGGQPTPSFEQTRVLALLAIVIVLASTLPISMSNHSNADRVTAVTYTIRYGYDNRWHYALEDIARAIEQSGADVVTLQEVDAGRLTSLGTDDVYYLARRLNMRSYYLPTVERLTGIAVLSRLPIVQAEGRLITSQQEQTGIVHAQLAAAGRDLHVYSTWLGIRGEDTQLQISEAIGIIGANSPTVLGGAFNTELGSSAYTAINEAGFDFAAFGLGAPSPYVKSRDPVPHTDYVWLRGLNSQRGWLPHIPPTNHKMVAVEFTLP
jgi:endonuclease/exonuclease/phosphatase family metal-dependent hydrolase